MKPTRLVIRIYMDNDAFQPTLTNQVSEVARILENFSNLILDQPEVFRNSGEDPINLYDLNGHAVGEAFAEDYEGD